MPLLKEKLGAYDAPTWHTNKVAVIFVTPFNLKPFSLYNLYKGFISSKKKKKKKK